MKNMQMKQLNFRIRDSIYNDLGRVARRHGMRRSELCRAVLATVASGNFELGVVSRANEVIKTTGIAGRVAE